MVSLLLADPHSAASACSHFSSSSPCSEASASGAMSEEEERQRIVETSQVVAETTQEEELQRIAALTAKAAELMLKIVEAINRAVEVENEGAADLLDESAD